MMSVVVLLSIGLSITRSKPESVCSVRVIAHDVGQVSRLFGDDPMAEHDPGLAVELSDSSTA